MLSPPPPQKLPSDSLFPSSCPPSTWDHLSKELPGERFRWKLPPSSRCAWNALPAFLTGRALPA